MQQTTPTPAPAPRRVYSLRWLDQSGHVEPLGRTTLAAARRAAERLGREGWEPAEETWWLDIAILDARGEHVETVTVTIDPTEPVCSDRRGHRWRDDGMPGFGATVTGHGGGVVVRHRCERCGLRRTVDTWAQRMDTGEQGLTSTRYDRDD